jgi:sulfoxide reductase heme-binding subunit YedZ
MSIAMTSLPRRSSNPWSVTIGMSALVLAIAALPILVWGADERSLRSIVRVTARCSGVLLFTVFAMPGLSRLPRAGWWLDRNSTAIFLSFTASHVLHLCALIAWAGFFPASFFADFQVVPVLLGGGLYVFIALIALRAVDGVSKGQLRLNRVETVGMYLLWGAFTLSFAAQARGSVLHAALTLAAVSALGTRLVPSTVAPGDTVNIG